MSNPNSETSERIERFGKTTRWIHWSFVLPFLCLAASGGALLLRETIGLSSALADGLARAHRLAGVTLIAGPALVWVSGQTREVVRDVQEAFRWRRDDLRWLALQPLAALGRAELPEAGKLNGGQKMNALLTMALGSGLALTGVWLWREPGALVPWFVHLALFLVWIPIFSGHFYLAALNPATRHALRGMLLGGVRRDWALHHHGRWAREEMRSSKPSNPSNRLKGEALSERR